MPVTRIKAASLHFVISLTLSLIVIGLLYFGWYPAPYFVPLGGLVLLAMIVGIDVVLGPLMTMILFNPAKSRRALALDLSLIGIVQACALVYGLYSGYVGRIVFETFDGQSFHLVQASDIPSNFLKRTQLAQYRELPYMGQRQAVTNVPDTPEAHGDLSFFKAFGLGAYAMPQYYAPLAQGRQQLATASIERTTLRARHPDLAAKIDTLLSKWNADWTGAAIVPFEVKTRTYTAVVLLEPVQLIKVLPADPR